MSPSYHIHFKVLYICMKFCIFFAVDLCSFLYISGVILCVPWSNLMFSLISWTFFYISIYWSTSFFFSTVKYLIMWIWHNLFNDSTMGGHWCFQNLPSAVLLQQRGYHKRPLHYQCWLDVRTALAAAVSYIFSIKRKFKYEYSWKILTLKEDPHAKIIW